MKLEVGMKVMYDGYSVGGIPAGEILTVKAITSTDGRLFTSEERSDYTHALGSCKILGHPIESLSPEDVGRKVVRVNGSDQLQVGGEYTISDVDRGWLDIEEYTPPSLSKYPWVCEAFVFSPDEKSSLEESPEEESPKGGLLSLIKEQQLAHKGVKVAEEDLEKAEGDLRLATKDYEDAAKEYDEITDALQAALESLGVTGINLEGV
jgi:hypothetical protein